MRVAVVLVVLELARGFLLLPEQIIQLPSVVAARLTLLDQILFLAPLRLQAVVEEALAALL